MFRYSINQAVKINISGEMGYIKGRAEYRNHISSYLLVYKTYDFRAAEAWFDEDDISSVDEE
ncbi:hypothetical protein [Photorhabdus khanii]|uniref:Uncharacterized protein n=1 Tax=Photorhabdus khanii subsp. guanajuatensis TaxID=2100166 RepID=A0A4R4JUM1_9GAMM|nr:hypothetical protein [Photorhabdus khanii]TDB57229.1 hypothetical protein C5467_11310 [Photorhabdus khanii subsp. guanajuatensis]